VVNGMKILLISLPANNGWGGSEELWADMVREALKDRDQVWITPRGGDGGSDAAFRDLLAAGATYLRRGSAPSASGTPEPEVVPAAVRELAPSADAILINAGASIRDLIHPAVVGLVDSLPEIPVVATVQFVSDRDALSDTERQQARKMLGRISRLVVPAWRSRQILERQVCASIPHCVVLPSPIQAGLTGLAWPEEPVPAMACVGRLDVEQKGQDLLLELLATEPWRTRDWRLTFYGGGSGTRYLGELARYYGLDERVALAGFEPDMTRVWGSNEILVLPSHEEGMPIVVLEAMACARPCVVTDVGDNARFVVDAETGFVAAGDRIVALATALERAWQHRPDWPQMGKRARERLLGMYDPRPGRTLLNLLRSVSVTAP
jgi:L-malate glycosyltransferase